MSERRLDLAEIRDRLEQARRALAEMPPHSGSGTRRALEDEILRLERLLAHGR